MTRSAAMPAPAAPPSPASTVLEQATLGAILTDNACYAAVADFLRPEHFYEPVHGRIYAAIQQLIARNMQASPSSLRRAFESDDALVHVGGARYLAELAAEALNLIDVGSYGRQLVDLWQRRRLIELCARGSAEAHGAEIDTDARTLIEAHLGAVDGIITGEAQKRGRYAGAVAIDLVSELRQVKAAGGMLGVSSGIKTIDAALGGLRGGNNYIIAGRPSMGKTALALTIAYKVARAGYPVGFHSLEMSESQCTARLLSALTGISSDDIQRANLTDSDFADLDEAQRLLADVPLYIDDAGGLAPAQILLRAKALKRTRGLSLLVVDYLQKVRAPQRYGSRTEEVTAIANQLHDVSKELDVPLILVSQLNRSVEARDDKRPNMSDLRESGTIEQNADVVAFVYREAYYLERAEPQRKQNEDRADYELRRHQWFQRLQEVSHLAEVIVEKNRHGPAPRTLRLHFDAPTTTFGDLAHEDEHGR